MIYTLLMVAHVLLAVAMVSLILLQRGKGAEAGTGFGAGASGTVFGARGAASFLTRTTGILATLFFVTSLSLAFLAAQPTESSSVTDLPGDVSEPLPAPGDFGDLPDILPADEAELPAIPVPDTEPELPAEPE